MITTISCYASLGAGTSANITQVLLLSSFHCGQSWKTSFQTEKTKFVRSCQTTACELS